MELKKIDKNTFNLYLNKPKESLLNRISFTRIFSVVSTLGIWYFKEEKWTKYDIRMLLKNADKKLIEDDIKSEIFHVCSGKKNDFLITTNGKNVVFYRIDPDYLKIIKELEIDVSQVLSYGGRFKTFEFREKNKKNIIKKLYFNDKTDLINFFKKLKKELKKEEYYYYKGIWARKESIMKIRNAYIGVSTNFKNFNKKQFNYLILILFKEMGHEASVIKGNNGVDIQANVDDKKVGIITYSKPSKIGKTEINKAVKISKSNKFNYVIIITKSTFKLFSKKYSKDTPVILWDNKVLNKKLKKHFLNFM